MYRVTTLYSARRDGFRVRVRVRVRVSVSVSARWDGCRVCLVFVCSRASAFYQMSKLVGHHRGRGVTVMFKVSVRVRVSCVTFFIGCPSEYFIV